MPSCAKPALTNISPLLKVDSSILPYWRFPIPTRDIEDSCETFAGHADDEKQIAGLLCFSSPTKFETPDLPRLSGPRSRFPRESRPANEDLPCC